MRTIFLAQMRQLVRNPWTFLIMMAMSVVMALVFGVQATGVYRVSVLPDSTLSETRVEELLALLGSSAAFEFETGDEALLDEPGNNALFLRIGERYWRVIASTGNEAAPALGQFVSRLYREDQSLRAAADAPGDAAQLRARVESALETPALSVSTQSVASEAEDSFAYDSRVQGAIGMSLFFAAFTILFGINMILEERRIGLWPRVITSPVSKAGMYGGHVAFTFLTGLIQLLAVFAVFNFVFDIRIGTGFLPVLAVIVTYVLAITALGMLLAGIVGTAQQMNVVIPIVAVSSAMIGGAYWPIEIVTNEFLLGVSRFLPLTHAMEAIKGLTYQAWGFAEILPALGFMLAFSAVCAVLGTWLVDRRA